MSLERALSEFTFFFKLSLLCLPSFLFAWAMTFGMLCAGFAWLKAHVRPVLLRMDDRVRYWAVGLRYGTRGDLATERHALTWFFRFWTNFSSSPSLAFWSFAFPILAICLGVLSAPVRHSAYAPMALLLPGWSFGGAMLFSFVSKRVFKRLRPERVPGAFGHKMKDGSFPSGHSLTSLVFWSMLVVALAMNGVPLMVVLGFALTGLAVVLLTGLSRVYLGVHFPSDVLGGYAIGLIWSCVCYLIYLPMLMRMYALVD